jgi:protein-L-isoaspartate(D-aspartate) O-methyltransferase
MSVSDKYQHQLLERAEYLHHETPLTEATKKAYLATPRHLFLKRYRQWGTREWHEVNQENLDEHLATLYEDKPLILFGEDDDNIPSTISQPSFVMRMLDLLQIKPGDKIFELGAGSGWNAALMGYLVGLEGHIDSLEIIPEVAQAARETIEALDIKNVSIITADGGDKYEIDTLYDRAIFTAGAYDLPSHFHSQIKEGGLLLVVIKNQGGGDNLFLLQKKTDYFESLESIVCGFVQLKGKYQFDTLEPTNIDTLPEWANLQHQEISRKPFWWGGKGKASFLGYTMGIRGFLSISDPSFRAFKTDKINDRSREYQYFGLWQPEHNSLVIAQDDLLIAYGNEHALNDLLEKVKEWVNLGMPSAASFDLKIYPIDTSLEFDDNQWIVKRKDSQFLWSLKTSI